MSGHLVLSEDSLVRAKAVRVVEQFAGRDRGPTSLVVEEIEQGNISPEVRAVLVERKFFRVPGDRSSV